MLTMGRPIQLISARDVGTLGDLFGEKIRANYEQMQGHIDPVEILHFLLTPPECYTAETGMTMLVNQQSGKECQNLEISLVNNMLNRILVSGRMAFTYQDRVFVENILRKLGVADVREFIRQVQKIKEVTRTVKELLAVYGSGRNTIRLLQEYRINHSQMQKIREKGKEKTEGKREGKKEKGRPEAEDRLADAVLKRLQIAAIYREAGRYSSFYPGSRTMLDRLELAFGEQSVAASYLTLNEYRSSILAPDQNFLQAALLHAMEQIFHIRYTEFTKNTGLWHEFMDALHVSVRNTFQRFERQQQDSLPQDRTMVFERQQQDFLPQEATALYLERGEDIRKQLARIDRQNKERVKRLTEYEERIKEAESLRIDLEIERRSAAEKVQEIERQAAAEKGREIERQFAAERVQETERLREILGDETMLVFETIRGYQEDPGRYPNVTASNEQAMNLLLRDIAAAGETQKTTPEVLSDIRSGQSEDPVELFYRQDGQAVNVESRQELLQNREKDKRIQSAAVQKAFHQETQVDEIVRSKVNEMKVKQEEEITRMINQNVKRQLDTLSEKVYGKLEKRMDAERRRRGL